MTDMPLLDVVACDSLSAADRTEIIALCTAVFAEDFARLFELLPGSRHVVLVGHACWVTRWLQPTGSPPLRTAYVEAVATRTDRQGQGLGRTVMARVASEIAGYTLGALSPAHPRFYEHLGWEHWCGPTAIRLTDRLLPTPGEEIMILRMAQTPPLDLDAPITAEWRTGELW